MKKYFVNEDWDLEAFEDKSDLFLLVIEQNLPSCSYIYKYDTTPETIQPDYLNFINQYKDTEVEGDLKIHLIKVPNTPQICDQLTLADSEHKGSTEDAIEAINSMLNRADCEFLESWTKKSLTENNHKKRRKPYDSISYTTGCPGLNMDFFNSRFGTGNLGETSCGDNNCFNDACNGSDCGEAEGGGLAEQLTEAKYDDEPKPKRYIKRYYIRHQNIFCSKKSDILKALVHEVGEANCSVYSLKSLDDHDDVHLLQPSDIIYYYDDGILYDKNHVKVMDYDLNVKHEEERPHFDPDTASDEKFDNVYDDRLVEALKEDDDTCVICGEKFEDYGNNPSPVSEIGRCCNACNLKFVIPARLEAGRQTYEKEKN
jgi:hypothetical protein